MISEYEIKKQICEIGKRIYDKGMVAANDGNISVKISDNEFLCTPTGVSKGFMTADYICKVDKEGNVIRARAIVSPVALAAGDEAACGELGIFMGRRRAAVGHSQGLAPRDAEDAARLRFFGIAQHIAVQIYRGLARDPQCAGDGHVLRQRIHAVSQAVGQIGVDVVRFQLRSGGSGKRPR